VRGNNPAFLSKSEDTAERYRTAPERLCGDSGFGMLIVLVTFLGNWCMRESRDDEVREDAITRIKCWSIKEAE
jgi:hypothetical protein